MANPFTDYYLLLIEYSRRQPTRITGPDIAMINMILFGDVENLTKLSNQIKHINFHGKYHMIAKNNIK